MVKMKFILPFLLSMVRGILPSTWKFCTDDGEIMKTDGDRKWPFIVRLSLNHRGFLCSGTLIDGTTVLTAAHCCLGHDVSEIKVSINDHNADMVSVNVRVQAIETHPLFVQDTYKRYTHDICVLKLKMEVTDLLSEIEGIDKSNHYPCIPKPDFKWGEESVCYTIGWDFAVNGKGIKKNSGIYTGKVEIMNKFQCYKSLNTYGQDHRQSSGEHNSSRGMICAAGHATEDDKFCEDDAGGPLLCESNGHAVLAGITSKGLNCSTKKSPAEFTEVANYVDFIKNFITDNTVQQDSMSRSKGGEHDDNYYNTEFQRMAERRADKSLIRRYCTKNATSSDFSVINLDEQQKKIDPTLQQLTECYNDIKARRLAKLPHATQAIRDREVLKLDAFGRKQVCRRADFKEHSEGLPCWDACLENMVDTQHNARKSKFTESEKDIIAYWIKDCSRRVIKRNNGMARSTRSGRGRIRRIGRN